MNLARLAAAILFLGGLAVGGTANAAELKVLSVEALKPALQELAPAFESASKHKVKIEYGTPDAVEKKLKGDEDYDVVIADKAHMDKLNAAADIAGGSMKEVVKHGADTFIAATPNSTQQPLPAAALIDFLHGPKSTCRPRRKLGPARPPHQRLKGRSLLAQGRQRDGVAAGEIRNRD
jgi:ABC-type molybdate transport system substrate-binding protein